jgi:hypothetical protein
VDEIGGRFQSGRNQQPQVLDDAFQRAHIHLGEPAGLRWQRRRRTVTTPTGPIVPAPLLRGRDGIFDPLFYWPDVVVGDGHVVRGAVLLPGDQFLNRGVGPEIRIYQWDPDFRGHANLSSSRVHPPPWTHRHGRDRRFAPLPRAVQHPPLARPPRRQRLFRIRIQPRLSPHPLRCVLGFLPLRNVRAIQPPKRPRDPPGHNTCGFIPNTLRLHLSD